MRQFPDFAAQFAVFVVTLHLTPLRSVLTPLLFLALIKRKCINT